MGAVVSIRLPGGYSCIIVGRQAPEAQQDERRRSQSIVTPMNHKFLYTANIESIMHHAVWQHPRQCFPFMVVSRRRSDKLTSTAAAAAAT